MVLRRSYLDRKVEGGISSQSVGFTITSGTTPKTLTVDEDLTASVVNDSLEGKKTKHGWNTQTLSSATQLTIAKPSTNWIFTLNCGANFEYYIEGVEVIITGTKTYDFGASPDQGVHYLFFDDATGTIKHRATVWNLYTEVPVASCFYNGTTWAIQEERHFAIRDRSWHSWAHSTIGARYVSGFDLTAPVVGSSATVNISGGTLYDEDIAINTSQATAVRIWFKTGANSWSFVDPATTPYDTSIKYTNASYTQTDVGATKYINQWYYGSSDTTGKIYVVREFVSAPYNNVAEARAIAPPNLNGSTYGFAGNAEMKLLYRLIWKGDDTVQEVTDYRLSSPVAGGGSAATTAAAVGYTPTAPETFVTVQGALDNRVNKSVLAALGTGLVKNTTGTGELSIAVSGTDIKTINSTSLLGSGNIDVASSGAFEIDINGNLVPTAAGSFSDAYFELDGSNNIVPKAA